MRKFLLIAVCLLVLILAGGAAFLMVWDPPAPSARIEHAIPDTKISK
jgi:hypothetical protein